jgi:DNA-binding LytR/AlgR family response regulator
MNTDRIKYLAIDDNALDLYIIEEFAKAYPVLQSCGHFTSINDGLHAIKVTQPKLVFLDIEMPEGSGIELLKQIKSDVPMAIFITSHAAFALEGYELSALDYILKPLTEDRFANSMRRVQEYWDMKQKASAYELLIENETLTIKEGYNKIKLQQQDIVYLEAMQDYTKLVTAQRKYMINKTLSGFMELLPADKFVRIHRSYAVALSQVKQLQQGEIIGDGFVLPVGKTYRKMLGAIKL